MLEPTPSGGWRAGLYLAGDQVELTTGHEICATPSYRVQRCLPFMAPSVKLDHAHEHYIVYLRSSRTTLQDFRAQVAVRGQIRWPVDHLPRGLRFGQSVILIAHPQGYVHWPRMTTAPGVVAVFRPSRLDVLVREGSAVLDRWRAQAAKALARGGDVRYYELAERQLHIDEVT